MADDFAYKINIEADEDGWWHLFIEGETLKLDVALGHDVAETLYDQCKARIGPWLRERNEARWTMPAEFRCNPDESGGYDISDPKHPDHHSVHADIWDMREGK